MKNLARYWDVIKDIFQNAQESSRYISIATVNASGMPHCTPIGSLIFGSVGSAYFFDEFPCKLSENLKVNNQVCVQAVNSNENFWAQSLMSGQFETAPGIRLLGTAGEKRIATQGEIDAWLEKVAWLKELKGYDILWKNMKYVRDLVFTEFEPVQCGSMTTHLWK